ncbi:MAG: cobyrinate a,c-diamide synthase [Gemmatimonadetes bacterium]|jgi:cobyrinic acid a,c-diamide synthase|nr:cobyrinate a,c-diamide synthase [Gemmatimonadota bacterium]
MGTPRILIAGLSGGSGKTLVSLGLLAAWRKGGQHLAPFKKGPDYIDASWLSMAAERDCRNLDLFLMSPQTIEQSFVDSCGEADVAVIEGNRGLFDGVDAQGSYSTAELAKLLNAPVVLVVDCTKSTCTIAAIVLGCQQFDPQVPIRGVVLNRTAGARHVSVLREAIEKHCGLPVLGALPKAPGLPFPERHLGLVPPQEHEQLPEAIRQAGDLAERHLDLEAIEDLARQAPAIERAGRQLSTGNASNSESVRIGVFRDAAFQFYYPENLEALIREGARLVEISPLRDPEVGEVDALYIGGGFPETLAPTLSQNTVFLGSLRRLIDRGLPVYAECGGAVYLGEKLLFEQKEYTMTGALPAVFAFGAKPQGHGYAELETVGENPFLPVGSRLRGHEFHYTYMQSATADDLTFAFRVRRGHGFDGEKDGLCRHNVLAVYTHVHALGVEAWAPGIVRAAGRFKAAMTAGAASCHATR